MKRNCHKVGRLLRLDLTLPFFSLVAYCAHNTHSAHVAVHDWKMY